VVDVNASDRAAGIVLLPTEAEFGRPSSPGLVTWWAARALHDPDLCDEDREMAEAAYSRAMDVQLGTVGKGADRAPRELFPFGDGVPLSDALRIAAHVDEGLLW
jgi:hypothetical protein